MCGPDSEFEAKEFERQKQIDASLKRIVDKLDREKHLSDIEFVNQNARGK